MHHVNESNPDLLRYLIETSYFLEKSNLLLLMPAKNGSTELLSLFFEYEGMNVEELNFGSNTTEGMWSQGIWTELHKMKGLFRNLSSERQQEIVNSSQIEKVLIVRNPLRRIWSAWTSKILLGEPKFRGVHDHLYGDRFTRESFVSCKKGELANYFESFLSLLSSEKWLLKDAHFASQASMSSGLPFAVNRIKLEDSDTFFTSKIPEIWQKKGKENRNSASSLFGGPLMTEESWEKFIKIYERDYMYLADLYSTAADYQNTLLINEDDEMGARTLRDITRTNKRLSKLQERTYYLANQLRETNKEKDRLAREIEHITSEQKRFSAIGHSPLEQRNATTELELGAKGVSELN
jgi:hypothetical protein